MKYLSFKIISIYVNGKIWGVRRSRIGDAVLGDIGIWVFSVVLGVDELLSYK